MTETPTKTNRASAAPTKRTGTGSRQARVRITSEPHQIHRGHVYHVVDNPFLVGDSAALQSLPDGGIVVDSKGKVAEVGNYREMKLHFPHAGTVNHTGSYLLPGFVDCHVHYPQVLMIACFGEQLLDWLEQYTFPEEGRYRDPDYAERAAHVFFAELIKNGTTTANIFGSQFPSAMEIAFQEAEQRRFRAIMGLNLSDRNIPQELRMTPDQAVKSSLRLANKWHGRGKAQYAVTPRFAPVCTGEMLAASGRLLKEIPGAYMHTHCNENRGEIGWMRELSPGLTYQQVYERQGLMGPRSVFAHSIYADDGEIALLASTGSSVAHCPSSNIFLGSGFLPLRKYVEAQVKVGLGTDIAGGTGLSMIKELELAYGCQMLLSAEDPNKAWRLSGTKLLYLATKAGADALSLADQVGSFQPGRAADIVVLDPSRETYLPERMRNVSSAEEEVFVLCIAGAGHLVSKVYIDGQAAYTDGPTRRARARS